MAEEYTAYKNVVRFVLGLMLRVFPGSVKA